MSKWMIALSALLVVNTVVAAGSGASRSSYLSGAERTYNSGVKLMLNKQFEDAEVKFRKAIERDEDFAKAHNNLAYTLRKQGRANFEEALSHYNRAIELEPKLAEPYMYRGVLYVQMDKPNLAKEDLDTLAQLDSDLAKELRHVIDQGQEKAPEQFFGVSKAVK
ncbi:tetratricopeptide repeat protein [Vibrio mexicanus]|uniref:tetratricopeptide repeat protein n=1 Tax=Vibrio mexicanus TaxID=1004326 RepID=UPI00063C8668|nr:tetratricopeptide repeat protein [Vibrio mexicanus]